MKRKNNLKVKIIIPSGADDEIDYGLIKITEKIARIYPKLVSHGFLGGEFGYGAKYENEVFMINPYCWCDKKDCPWCRAENPAPNFQYDGLKIWWYKWIGRSMKFENKPSLEQWEKILRKCLRSIK